LVPGTRSPGRGDGGITWDYLKGKGREIGTRKQQRGERERERERERREKGEARELLVLVLVGVGGEGEGATGRAAREMVAS
jgi:hypothetical protein